MRIPISLLVVWLVCFLWVLAFYILYTPDDELEIFGKTGIIKTISCRHKSFKNRSYVHINSGSNDKISFTVKGDCSQFTEKHTLGKTYSERGPKAKLVDSVVSWEVIIDGREIKNFNESLGNKNIAAFMGGLLPPVLIFIASLVNWRSGRWKGWI